MKIGQITRIETVRRRKSGDTKSVEYSLITQLRKPDASEAWLLPRGQKYVRIVRLFKTRQEAEQYKKENL